MHISSQSGGRSTPLSAAISDARRVASIASKKASTTYSTGVFHNEIDMSRSYGQEKIQYPCGDFLTFCASIAGGFRWTRPFV